MPWARSFCPLPFPSDGDRWFRAYWVISTVQVVLFLGFEYFRYICACYSNSYDYDRIYT